MVEKSAVCDEYMFQIAVGADSFSDTSRKLGEITSNFSCSYSIVRLNGKWLPTSQSVSGLQCIAAAVEAEHIIGAQLIEQLDLQIKQWDLIIRNQGMPEKELYLRRIDNNALLDIYFVADMRRTNRTCVESTQIFW